MANADSVMVSESLRRDFDKPLLAVAFPGWSVEAGFELKMEETVAVGSRDSGGGRCERPNLSDGHLATSPRGGANHCLPIIRRISSDICIS